MANKILALLLYFDLELQRIWYRRVPGFLSSAYWRRVCAATKRARMERSPGGGAQEWMGY